MSIARLWFNLCKRKDGIIYRREQLLSCYDITRASLVAQMAKILLAMRETQVQSLGREDPLEKGMATHSSIFAWRISWTEELGDYSSWGLKELDMLEQQTL